MNRTASASNPSRVNGSPRQRKEVTQRVLVVSEGTVTEPAYFNLLRRELEPRLGLAIKVQPKENANAKRNTDPLSIVNECKRLRDKDRQENSGSARDVLPFVACFAIVDVDDYDKGNSSPLKRAAKLAEEENITLLITNKKFETWLVWHSDQAVQPKPESRALSKQCEDLRLFSGKKRKKLSSDFPITNYDQAVTRAMKTEHVKAGQVGQNPSSAMPVFFQMLERL